MLSRQHQSVVPQATCTVCLNPRAQLLLVKCLPVDGSLLVTLAEVVSGQEPVSLELQLARWGIAHWYRNLSLSDSCCAANTVDGYVVCSVRQHCALQIVRDLSLLRSGAHARLTRACKVQLADTWAASGHREGARLAFGSLLVARVCEWLVRPR